MEFNKAWYTEEEVRQSGKPKYSDISKPPKWYLSRTLCKSAKAPVTEDEEPVAFRYNNSRHKYSALFDRKDLEMWRLPMYYPNETRPEGIVAPAVASPRIKKGEKPVAYIRHIDSFTPLYARPKANSSN